MSDTNSKITGGCSCGNVRYELKEEPMFIHCCHCHLCQQQTGSAFITHAFIEDSNLVIHSGELGSFQGPSGSVGKHTVKACNNCGAAIVSYFGPTTHLAIIKVGTFDNPSSSPPNAHIFTETMVAWIKVPNNIKCYKQFYSFQEAWPSESFSRLQKVRKIKT